jgi:hypothetical protein
MHISIQGLPEYPHEWDELTRQVAFHVGVTKTYYERGIRSEDWQERGMVAAILIERIAEIMRRGWHDRANKYLTFEGGLETIDRIDQWACNQLAEYRRCLENQKQRKGTNGGYGGNGRFAKSKNSD